MGVTGLHKFVSSVAHDTHLSQFRGQTLAVDVSAWLHRGLFSCAAEVLAAQPTDQFLSVPIALIELLQSHGVTPYCVFDGAQLPLKEGHSRRQSRADHRARALQLLAEGKESEARHELGKAANVAPWMATLLIDELMKRDLPFVVAPHEADPQLAFLVREGLCAAAISEDSDLLAYGCPRTLFKLDEKSGTALKVELDDLRGAEDARGVQLFDGHYDGEWAAWRHGGLFLDLCIVCGTDYLASLARVGIKSAHTSLRTNRTLERALARPPFSTALTGGESRAAYIAQVAEVRAVFRHALVFDPRISRVVPLHPLPADEALPTHLLGRVLDDATALDVCRNATLDPATLAPRARVPRTTDATRTIATALIECSRVQQQGALALPGADAASFAAVAAPLVPTQHAAPPPSAPSLDAAVAACTAARRSHVGVAPQAAPSPQSGLAPQAASPSQAAPTAARRATVRWEDALRGAALGGDAFGDGGGASVGSSTQPPSGPPEAAPAVTGGASNVHLRRADGEQEMAMDERVPGHHGRGEGGEGGGEGGGEDDDERTNDDGGASDVDAPAAPPTAAAPECSSRRGLVAEYAAHQVAIACNGDDDDDGALGMSVAMLRAASAGLQTAECSEMARIWMLHAHLSVALRRPKSLRDCGRSPADSADGCLGLLEAALAFLMSLREHVVMLDDDAQTLLSLVLESSWRQALLRPLREQPLNWRRFRTLVTCPPHEVALALRPELEALCQPHPGGRPCKCLAGTVASLPPSTCEQPYTCTEVRRRVGHHLARFPPTSIASHLRLLLAATVKQLPPPQLLDARFDEVMGRAVPVAPPPPSTACLPAHLGWTRRRRGRGQASHEATARGAPPPAARPATAEAFHAPVAAEAPPVPMVRAATEAGAPRQGQVADDAVDAVAAAGVDAVEPPDVTQAASAVEALPSPPAGTGRQTRKRRVDDSRPSEGSSSSCAAAPGIAVAEGAPSTSQLPSSSDVSSTGGGAEIGVGLDGRRRATARHGSVASKRPASYMPALPLAPAHSQPRRRRAP